ncbi:MAG: hypothetical protein QW409_00745, partial [Candidatus Aenigmatarchaeota archaeon]
MDVMSRASLEQEIYLRALTGYVVGQHIADGYKKVAIITYPDRICSAMASALATSLIAKFGYKENFVRVFTYEEGKEKELAKKVKEFNPEAVYISFGGEQRMSYVSKITKEVLKALLESNYKESIIFHVRTFLATKQLSELLSDHTLRNYLMSVKELRVFTADIQNKKFLFHKIKIENNNIKLEKFSEAQINDEHISL